MVTIVPAYHFYGVARPQGQTPPYTGPLFTVTETSELDGTEIDVLIRHTRKIGYAILFLGKDEQLWADVYISSSEKEIIHEVKTRKLACLSLDHRVYVSEDYSRFDNFVLKGLTVCEEAAFEECNIYHEVMSLIFLLWKDILPTDLARLLRCMLY
jgi:hypothetical protein